MDTSKETKKTDEFDIDIQACSTMDCTGLIPSLPQNKDELEAYEDLYPYITHSVKIKNQDDVAKQK
ncbi:MAG: hypothetical protein ACLTKI_03920 [Lachnospiraceae bacterium]